MKKILICFIFSMCLVGCGGRTPHPVAIYQPDDDQLTCSQIKESIDYNEQQVYKLYPKAEKTGKNVALGITGYFLIVPLFFMDFSHAEQQEIDAFQQRDQHLHFLAERENCGRMPPKLVIKTKASAKKTA